MQGKTIVILIVIFIFFYGCHRAKESGKLCINEKAFISLDTYVKIQDKSEKDCPIFPHEKLLPAINIDSFSDFNQVDSMKEFICRQEIAPYGIIPLKYCYNNDTIFLYAFPFGCGGGPDMKLHIIDVRLAEKSINFDFVNSKIDINESRLRDTLINTFTKSFKLFFEWQYIIKEKIIDTIILQKLAVSKQISRYAFAFRIEVDENKYLKRIKEPINLILTTYLYTLRKCIKSYYRKDICELSTTEIRIFSMYLFLHFEISKTL